MFVNLTYVRACPCATKFLSGEAQYPTRLSAAGCVPLNLQAGGKELSK